jgi:hypothetical protein
LRVGFGLVLPLTLGLAGASGRAEAQELVGFAKLPADSFTPGPTSGQFITAANGRTPPFLHAQPVQGVSSVLRACDGGFLAMQDNGFGAKANSADALLRFYQIDPDVHTKSGGSGGIELRSVFTLRDPNRKINFPIVADMTSYPNAPGPVPVDPLIGSRKLLTGSDFDIESFRRAPDGTLWFGDEFGPFLVHTDADGRVLEAPFPLPGVQSPDNPFLGAGSPNLLRSKGFEGMAITPSGKRLYPMLEGALTTDPDQRRLRIFEFSLKNESYTGRQWWYHMEDSGNSIGDFTAVTERDFLVIERDNFQGAAAKFKKIFLVSFDNVDSLGFLVKDELVDLLNISDPDDLGGLGTTFTFPFQTIESVIPLDRFRIGVLNDNNYPFSSGRTPGQPDDDEFIVIRLKQPLPGDGSWHGGRALLGCDVDEHEDHRHDDKDRD